jgi:hypothetical protein
LDEGEEAFWWKGRSNGPESEINFCSMKEEIDKMSLWDVD